jgi:hypothetical protein
VKSLTDTDWAYLAGFADGDGCISTSERKKKGTGEGYGKWRVFLTIAQRDQVSLLELRELFDVGRFYVYPTKPLAVWRTDKRPELKWLLENLLPFLRLKKSQAEAALRILEDVEDQGSVIELKALKAHRTIQEEGE